MVIGRFCLATAVAECERRPARSDLNELPILVGQIDMQDSVGKVYVTRTISTEQWARAATADDTRDNTPLIAARPEWR